MRVAARGECYHAANSPSRHPRLLQTTLTIPPPLLPLQLMLKRRGYDVTVFELRDAASDQAQNPGLGHPSRTLRPAPKPMGCRRRQTI